MYRRRLPHVRTLIVRMDCWDHHRACVLYVCPCCSVVHTAAPIAGLEWTPHNRLLLLGVRRDDLALLYTVPFMKSAIGSRGV